MNRNTSFVETCRLGIIQLKAKPGEVDFNIREAEKHVEQAARLGAELILLPELWALGYCVDSPEKYSEYYGGRITGFMSELAKNYKVYIAGGYPEKDEKDNCYNSAVLINPEGKSILNHRKVHLYSGLARTRYGSLEMISR